MHRTYETRLLPDLTRDSILGAYAELCGRVERVLFAQLRAGEPVQVVKRVLLIRLGLTARQLNALAIAVQGKISSIRERRSQLIKSLGRRVARARKVLGKIPRGTNTHHQKRRRLAILGQRLVALQADEASSRIRLCFGARKLFRAQFALRANGYASHEAWLRAWRAARSNQFFVQGSKDETAGCQGCVATIESDGTIRLRLRLPNALAVNGKYLVIPGLRFAYGHEAVVAAVGRNLSQEETDWDAISWRFVRDPKGWRVCVTLSVPPGRCISADKTGVVAIDLNADHLAVTDVDRFGNPVASFRIQRTTRGRTHYQAIAAIGEAVSQVVTYAYVRQKPIVTERLNFEEKKAELEYRGARYSRMLSRFAYSAFHSVLAARTYDAGLTLRRVHAAYTTLIGTAKFANRYGLSGHQAAALTIGRRGMQLAERPNRHMGDRVAFPLPVRNRGKHVWSFWRQVARRAAAHNAHGRPGHRARSSPAPAPLGLQGTAWRAIRSSVAGGTPARESSAALFG